MKRPPCLYSAPAAMALGDFPVSRVAAEIDVTEERLEDELFAGGVLTAAEAKRLRSFFWRYRIVLVNCWLFDGAARIGPLDDLRTSALFAERCPESRNDGLAFWLFARAWRTWLRLTRQRGRIGRQANAVRRAASEGHE